MISYRNITSSFGNFCLNFDPMNISGLSSILFVRKLSAGTGSNTYKNGDPYFNFRSNSFELSYYSKDNKGAQYHLQISSMVTCYYTKIYIIQNHKI